jgi:hypothetical protein
MVAVRSPHPKPRSQGSRSLFLCSLRHQLLLNQLSLMILYSSNSSTVLHISTVQLIERLRNEVGRIKLLLLLLILRVVPMLQLFQKKNTGQPSYEQPS